MARAKGSSTSTKLCYICGAEAKCPVGNASNPIWLCNKHYGEHQKAEEFLTNMFKQTVEMQALINVKQKYVMEQQAMELLQKFNSES